MDEEGGGGGLSVVYRGLDCSDILHGCAVGKQGTPLTHLLTQHQNLQITLGSLSLNTSIIHNRQGGEAKGK